MVEAENVSVVVYHLGHPVAEVDHFEQRVAYIVAAVAL